jgi:hypothetical protein
MLNSAFSEILFYLLHTINAAMAPGTHPNKVRIVTIKIVPQPLSKTASGGKSMHNKALPHPIFFLT